MLSKIKIRILKVGAEDYFKTAVGKNDLEDKVKELKRLTDAQSLQTAAETHANVRERKRLMFNLDEPHGLILSPYTVQAIMSYLRNSEGL